MDQRSGYAGPGGNLGELGRPSVPELHATGIDAPAQPLRVHDLERPRIRADVVESGAISIESDRPRVQTALRGWNRLDSRLSLNRVDEVEIKKSSGPRD